MPLTLRPTGLSRDPNARDWNVFDGGSQPVGRIYEDKTAPVEGSRWAWFLQIVGASRAGVPMTGRAANLDEAKSAFKASYDGYQAWSVTDAWKHTINDAVSALIVRWDGGRVGVSYTFADGAREAHAVRTDDWPVINRLKAAGKLTYQDGEVRAGMDEIARRGLDR
jgi:hypothetical protein